ncbi:ProQ/FinO family protein [Burkholderia gladioli]|uniref:ProQ/FinO family protein n=1 Tax=Burkholderia gladioli TaxID=28095 RepID=UPI00264CB1FC|nr:ProQ/FinO family protein [Burkholderia gladioli]MDN7715305.1 ProQ/FinO family protein [Burkholderia gladioli]
MGFEQLAELKKQLAKQRADAKPQGKSSTQVPAKSSGKPAHKPGGRPAAAGGKPSSGKPAHAQTRRPAPAADAKPVNPTVLAIGKLQRRFPAAFPKSPAPKLPLKIGIFKDLVAHTAELGLDEAQLRDAIKEWCRGSRYWACLVDGAKRVDLNGAEAGDVTAQQAAGAVRLDQARRSRAAAKAKAGDAAKRGEAGKDGEVAKDVAAGDEAGAAQAVTAQDQAGTPALVEASAAADEAQTAAPAATEATPAADAGEPSPAAPEATEPK